MSCRCFYRLIVFVLVTAMTLCTILSLVGPLLVRTITNDSGSTTVLTIGFVNIDNTTTTAAGVVTKTRTHTSDVTCTKAKSYYLASLALVIISAILGGLNVFCALVWVMAPCGFPIGIIVFLLTFVCFVGTIVPFILIALLVTAAQCNDALSQAIASDASESLEGKPSFSLLLVAFIGLFVALVLQLIGCACGCQMERSNSVRARDPTIDGADRSSLYAARSGDNYKGTEMR